MEWFFTFRDGLPAGSGFALYGGEHLLFLAGIAACAAAACAAYGRAGEARQAVWRRAVACVCLALEAAKQIILFATLPAYPIDQLPFHLCGLGIFVQAADAFAPRLRGTTREIIYCLSLPGAVAALLFADWTVYPVPNVFCLQSFIIHGVLLCYPLMLLTGRQLRPNPRALWRAALFLLAVAPPLYVFNLNFGTNYLFINGGTPGSPLLALENLMGNPGYLIGYAGILLGVWLVLYAPFVIQSQIRHRAPH